MKGNIKIIFRYLFLFMIIVSLNFLLPRLMKADPFLFLSSEGIDDISGLNTKQLEQYYIYYGLDKSLLQQYLYYLKGIFTGNLGFSISKTLPVDTIIFSHILWTVLTVFSSLVLTVLLGVILGSTCAYYSKKKIGNFIYLFFVLISQIPPFLVGFLFLVTVAFYVPNLPIAGGITPFVDFEWTYVVMVDILKHSLLPILTLIMVRLPHFFMLMRSEMINELNKKYVFIEKIKGFKDLYILYKHCLRNSTTAIFSESLLSIAMILQGSLVIENVFEYPGIGKLLKDAVFTRDYPLLQGIFLFMVIISLSVSFISEIIKENRKKSEKKI